MSCTINPLICGLLLAIFPLVGIAQVAPTEYSAAVTAPSIGVPLTTTTVTEDKDHPEIDAKKVEVLKVSTSLTSNKVSIKLNDNQPITKVKLLNDHQELVFKATLYPGSVGMALTHLAIGHYTFDLRNEDGKSTQVLVVE